MYSQLCESILSYSHSKCNRVCHFFAEFTIETALFCPLPAQMHLPRPPWGESRRPREQENRSFSEPPFGEDEARFKPPPSGEGTAPAVEGVRLLLSAKQKCHIAVKSRPKKSTSFVFLGFLCDMILRFKCTGSLCISQDVSGELLPSALLFMRRMSQVPFGAVKRVVEGAAPYRRGCPRFWLAETPPALWRRGAQPGSKNGSRFCLVLVGERFEE